MWKFSNANKMNFSNYLCSALNMVNIVLSFCTYIQKATQVHVFHPYRPTLTIETNSEGKSGDLETSIEWLKPKT